MMARWIDGWIDGWMLPSCSCKQSQLAVRKQNMENAPPPPLLPLWIAAFKCKPVPKPALRPDPGGGSRVLLQLVSLIWWLIGWTVPGSAWLTDCLYLSLSLSAPQLSAQPISGGIIVIKASSSSSLSAHRNAQ